MKPFLLRQQKSLLLIAPILVGFSNLCNGGSDLLYVSYGDRRGYTRPNTIEKFAPATLADLGVFSSSGLSLPQGLALGPDGILYVANYGNDTISRFTREGVGSIFAHTASGPTSLVFDPAGNLYVANYWASNIQKFTPTGVGSVFASSGLLYPSGLAIDSHSNIYVANAGSLTIRKFTLQGVSSTFAQTPEVNRPFGGLACDAFGNLYLGCQATNQPGILKFTPNGVSSVFHTGLGLPTSFAFDGEGNIYAANYGSDTIEKLSPTGVLLASVSTLGPVTQPSPWGIALRPPCRITCPTNSVVCADYSQCGAVVHFASPVATNCVGLSVACLPPSGSFFPVGTNLVTCTAQGSFSQLEDVCTFEVVVLDCEAPVIHSLSATPSILWPPNGRMQPVTISVTATDNCETPNCRIISITSEPDTNPRTRPARVDWDLTGGLSLNLRAKRAGTRTDRTYTITIQCTDLAGNASTRTVAVTVPHDRRGVSTVSR